MSDEIDLMQALKNALQAPTRLTSDELTRVRSYVENDLTLAKRDARALLAELDAVTRERDAATEVGRETMQRLANAERERNEARKDSVRLDHVRTSGLLRVAPVIHGVAILPERTKSLDAFREFLDDDIADVEFGT